MATALATVPKRDRRHMPLNLKRYRPGVFEQLHGCGSGVLTGSQVSALFGVNVNRFVGRYALARHIAGKTPLPEISTPLTVRGQRMQRMMLEWTAEEQGWEIDQIAGYAQHPKLPRLIASPDGVIFPPADVEIVTNEGTIIPAGPGPIEGKVVADFVFERLWADGPPVDVLLQNQTQIGCTDASWGAISALVLGSTRCDLIVYPQLPNPRAQAAILDAAQALFAILDADELPPPDEHKSSIKALQQAFPRAVPNKITPIDTDEAVKRFDKWRQASLDRLANEKIEKAQKNWFFCQDPEAEQFTIGREREINIKTVERAESRRIIKAGTYRKWDLDRLGSPDRIGEDKE